MGRNLHTTFIITLVAASAMLTLPVQAQTTTPQPTSLNTTEAATSTITPTATVTATVTTTGTATTPSDIQQTPDDSDSPLVLPTPTPGANAASLTSTEAVTEPVAPVTATTAATATTGLTGAIGAQEGAPLEGTIIANRSDVTVRFFVEGQTYALAPDESRGLSLARTSAALNLYSCAADAPESETGCFWDPYVVQQDGFFEIDNAPSETSGRANLLLRNADAPPGDQVWIQNRTGNNESVVYRDETIQLPPTTIHELQFVQGAPAILYVRNCLAVDEQSVCEWAPKTLEAGTYYALVEVETPGSEPDMRISAIELRPVVGGSEVAQDAGIAAAANDVIRCTLQVPVLNIRSGPGLQYEIIGKLRGEEGQDSATVTVDGRSPDEQWLTVAEESAQDGWITGSTSFITCNGNLADLPIVQASAPPPTPVPQPTVEATDLEPAAPSGEGESETTEEPTGEETAGEATAQDEPAVPSGQSLLLVNNGFQHDIRITVDQQFRPNEGPSEHDLQPGQSTSIVVYPGHIAFTVSSPWSGLSENADVTVEADQSLTMWVRFALDEGGDWALRWN